jgi:cation diffusion facilitator CzcD-associated flavoprotein CzcO
MSATAARQRVFGFVADRYDLRRDIRFGEKVTGANWDQAAERWKLTTDCARAAAAELHAQRRHQRVEPGAIIPSNWCRCTG